MRIFGLNITKIKKLDPLVVEILENHINLRLICSGSRTREEFIQKFKEFYTFLEIVRIIESEGFFTFDKAALGSEDDADDFRIRLHCFYKMIHVVNRLEILEQCNVKSHNVTVTIEKDNYLMNNLSFTTKC